MMHMEDIGKALALSREAMEGATEADARQADAPHPARTVQAFPPIIRGRHETASMCARLASHHIILASQHAIATVAFAALLCCSVAALLRLRRTRRHVVCCPAQVGPTQRTYNTSYNHGGCFHSAETPRLAKDLLPVGPTLRALAGRHRRRDRHPTRFQTGDAASLLAVPPSTHPHSTCLGRKLKTIRWTATLLDPSLASRRSATTCSRQRPRRVRRGRRWRSPS